MLRRIVCSGNSDPGTRALISPWTKMKGSHFDDSKEDDNFMYEFKRDLEDKDWEANEDEYSVIRIDSKDKDRFFQVMDEISKVNSKITVYGTSSEDGYIIEETEDLDVKEDPPTSKKSKEKS